jgi:hypothetical protein
LRRASIWRRCDTDKDSVLAQHPLAELCRRVLAATALVVGAQRHGAGQPLDRGLALGVHPRTWSLIVEQAERRARIAKRLSVSAFLGRVAVKMLPSSSATSDLGDVCNPQSLRLATRTDRLI